MSRKNCYSLVQPTGLVLAPLEDIIHRRLIPAISGRTAPSEAERILLTFPCRHGGLGVANPATFALTVRRLITTALYDKNTMIFCRAKSQARSEATKAYEDSCRYVANDLAISLAEEKGASSWRPIAMASLCRRGNSGMASASRLDAFSPAHHLCLREGIHHCSRLVLSFRWVPPIRHNEVGDIGKH